MDFLVKKTYMCCCEPLAWLSFGGCSSQANWLPKAQWVKYLQKDYPTAAFRASINNPFGKGSLINLLRQFSKLHADRKQVSVGLIGYPNTGKSSIINTLRGKKVTTTAPIPGETKVWQYVTLMKRIYLIDCPGIVPQNHHDAPKELLLRGVVRVENVEHPEQYIPAVLKRVKKHHMARTYQLGDWNDDHVQFLELLARKGGRLLKGGEPDVDGVAKMVLNDFMRGKIPWFVPPPVEDDEDVEEAAEREDSKDSPQDAAPKKRKRDVMETVAEETSQSKSSVNEDDDEDEDDFEGFGSGSDPEISDDSESEAGEEEDEETGGAPLPEAEQQPEEQEPPPPPPPRRTSKRRRT